MINRDYLAKVQENQTKIENALSRFRRQTEKPLTIEQEQLIATLERKLDELVYRVLESHNEHCQDADLELSGDERGEVHRAMSSITRKLLRDSVDDLGSDERLERIEAKVSEAANEMIGNCIDLRARE